MRKPYYKDKWVTIYHGDCRDILPELEVADLIATDPPYGVGLTYTEQYTDGKNGYWDWFLPTIELMRKAAKVVIFTHRNFSLKYIHDWDWIGVWNKPMAFGLHIGNSPLLPHWEPIYFYGIHGCGFAKSMSDILTFNPERAQRSPLAPEFKKTDRRPWEKSAKYGKHPCPKPAGLYEKLISIFTEPDNTVVDCFLGTGTTCLAAKKLHRYSIGIEIVEKYCELAARKCSQQVLELRG